MTIMLKPDDAYAFRQALERVTHNMVSNDDRDTDETNEISLASIAVSLKRIADALSSDA